MKRFSRDFLLTGAGILIYIAIKAYVSSFTHDESYTWLQYIHDSFFDIFTYKKSFTNNHLLNTLGMKYSEMIFGNSEFALRLPNLLAFILFLVYSYLILKRENRLVALTAFLLLITNNPLIDLFGLARGYGLSFAFMLMSFYHFIESFYSRKFIHALLFHIGAMLAILSSFTLLTFYLVLLAAIPVITAMDCFVNREKYPWLQQLKIHILPLAGVIPILFEPVRRVIKFNHFDFGGKEGFFHDVLGGLAEKSFHNYEIPSWLLIILEIAILAIITGSVFFILLMTFRRNTGFFSRHKGFISAGITLFLLCVLLITMHNVSGTDYPVGRFGLFFYPLFVIHLAFLCSLIAEKINKKIVAAGCFTVIAGGVFLFSRNADIYSCSEWGYDRNTKNMMGELAKQHTAKTEKVKLGIDWIFEPTINYYRMQMNTNWLLPADRGGLKPEDDYRYVTGETFRKGSQDEFRIIIYYETSDTYFLQKK